jgi:hypothetical protein
MDAQSETSDPAVLTIEHELELIGSAVAMVASGGAPRVQLASLRFAEQLLRPARRMALQAGVRIVPLWHADEAGVDIAVERIPE